MSVRVFRLLLLFLCSSLCAEAEIKDTLVVAHDGSGKYDKIQDAIERIRAFMDYTVVVYVKMEFIRKKL